METFVLFVLAVMAYIAFDALLAETSPSYVRVTRSENDAVDYSVRAAILIVMAIVAWKKPEWLPAVLTAQLVCSPVVWWVHYARDKAEERATADVVCRMVNRNSQKGLLKTNPWK